MTTTIHIPADLLERVDRRAKVLGISRNRVILAAVEASLESRSDWSPEFVQMLQQPIDEKTGRAFEASLAAVRKARTRPRRAPRL